MFITHLKKNFFFYVTFICHLQMPLIQTSKIQTSKNQSVENAGVAFVKRTHERNAFSEKIWMCLEEQDEGLTISGTNWFGDELR